jgi:ATPase subunit of ABC transporter with duplicated ATPase domains
LRVRLPFLIMGLLLTVQSVSKTFGSDPLFESISFTVLDGSRIGLIGPNGAGKSTLLGIIAGRISPDDGEVVVRKGVTVSYVAQDSSFEPGLTIRQVLEKALPIKDEMERLAMEFFGWSVCCATPNSPASWSATIVISLRTSPPK